MQSPWLYHAAEAVDDTLTNSRLARFRRCCIDLEHFVSDPVFVKVGANDGVTGDPCSDILLSGTRWRGLLIEPVPYCFERLRENFSDSNRFSLERVAVGTTTERTTFYYVAREAITAMPNLPNWYDQLGSFDKGHILKHLTKKLEPFIVECEVEICPLTDVLRRNRIEFVHLLHVDTEGHDLEVLKSLDLPSYLPALIFVEHAHLASDEKRAMRRLLRKHGYSVCRCRGDYFALHKMAYRDLKRMARKQHA